MSLGSLAAASPLSAEFQVAHPERCEDVDRKQRLIADFLRARECDALLLQQPANFAWFTSGGEVPHAGPGGSPTSLLITPDSRVVATNNVDSGALFDRELGGLGFLLKERPWQEPAHVLVTDLCRGRKVISDTPCEGTQLETTAIAALRQPLNGVECERLKIIGLQVTHAVEATARGIDPGLTEAEIAGQVAHRLVKRELTPVSLRVAADGRSRLYRHYRFGDAPLQRWATISATASRWGLCCSASRIVCFGNPPDDLAAAYKQVAMVHGTGIHFSSAGKPFTEVWEKVRRIYEKVGQGDEWLACDQADLTGYQPVEQPLLPKTELKLAGNMPIHWHPSIGCASMGDTILVGPEGPSLLTPARDWPTVCVAVRNHELQLPDLLCREPGEQK